MKFTLQPASSVSFVFYFVFPSVLFYYVVNCYTNKDDKLIEKGKVLQGHDPNEIFLFASDLFLKCDLPHDI